ncbi:hypothetical protein ACP70R_004934 [Stipagrostis hirtigluma subsp. patula]
MAALQSCRFISPTPAMSAASAIGRSPSTLSMVTAGRRELCFPGLKLQQHQAAALRPRVTVRAQHRGGGGQPAGKSADQHFLEEREHVMSLYADIIDFDQGCLYVEATQMSAQVCLSANEALKMASHVMDSAYLNIGAPNEISTGTIHTTLLAYADIFVDAADDADGRTVSKKTMTSFIGALKGLASVSHILLEAALESLSHTHPRESLSEYAFNFDVKAVRHEFKQLMNELEDGIRSASAVEICRMAMPTILEAMEITESFVGLMVARRQRALGKAHSKSKVVA